MKQNQQRKVQSDMVSRVVARKPARLIPIFPGEEPYFDKRGGIPVNGNNTAQAHSGIYRAKLVEITPAFNRTPASIGGLAENHLYAWVYRTAKERHTWFYENGVDDDGEAFEFVHYTGIELGDPIASLTQHVGTVIGEVPDPDVMEAVGLNRMIGSTVNISVKHGKYTVPSLKAEIAWFGEADHLRRGPHMVGVASGLISGSKPQSGWREELEARARERLARARPAEAFVLRITDAKNA